MSSGHKWIYGLLVCVFVAGVAGCVPEETDGEIEAAQTQASPAPQPPKLTIDERVEKELRDFVFKNVNLIDVKAEDAIDFVREHTGLNIFVCWETLEAEDDDARSRKITVRAEKISADVLLKLILMAMRRYQVSLDYKIDQGVIVVSTYERLNEQLFTRVYDVSDLLSLPRDMSYISEVLPPDRLHENPYNEDAMRRSWQGRWDQLQRLTRLIKEQVARDSWYPDGSASIRDVDDLLVVNQTHRNHKQIRKLLDKLRTGYQKLQLLRQVTVKTWLIRLSEKQLAALGEAGKRKSVPQVISRSELKTADVVYQGQIACFNRQKVSLSSGRGQLVVTGADPIVADNVAAFRPIVRMVHLGPVLETRVVLQPSGKKVKVQFDCLYSKPSGETTTRVLRLGYDNPKAKGGKVPQKAPQTVLIDVLKFYHQTLNTDVIIPLDKPVLVGGLAGKPGDKPAGTGLYLVVKVNAAK